MKASRLTAVGLVAAAGLWIASGHFLPHESAESRAALRTRLLPALPHRHRGIVAGLRWGEAVGLTRANIDALRSRIIVGSATFFDAFDALSIDGEALTALIPSWLGTSEGDIGAVGTLAHLVLESGRRARGRRGNAPGLHDRPAARTAHPADPARAAPRRHGSNDSPPSPKPAARRAWLISLTTTTKRGAWCDDTR